MELKDALHELQQDQVFKKWKGAHKSSYFSHAFHMLQDPDTSWQFGYYQKKDNRVTSFVVTENGVSVREDEEMFKKEDTHVQEIDLSKVKLPLAQVIGKAADFQEKYYPKDKSIKIIAILQSVDNLGSVWNITYVTQAFNTLNMKIDPGTGKVLEHQLSSILSLRRD